MNGNCEPEMLCCAAHKYLHFMLLVVKLDFAIHDFIQQLLLLARSHCRLGFYTHISFGFNHHTMFKVVKRSSRPMKCLKGFSTPTSTTSRKAEIALFFSQNSRMENIQK